MEGDYIELSDREMQKVAKNFLVPCKFSQQPRIFPPPPPSPIVQLLAFDITSNYQCGSATCTLDTALGWLPLQSPATLYRRVAVEGGKRLG